jgi:iron complex transport system ATP-binding protein
MLLIDAIDISAGYGEKPIFHDIHLSLESGEFLGLIGPNGAGKSTLLRALTGVLPLQHGEILLQGKDQHTLNSRERARMISFVPQSEPTLFEFTVRDVTMMGRHPWREGMRGYSQRDFDAAVRAMSDADILHLADRSVTELSGGEHRRVLLARALAQQAPAMVMDEPTAHLDLTHQAEILQIVRERVTRQNAGALAALHDLNLAAEYCDRLALLAEGRMLAIGTPAEIMQPDLLLKAYGAHLHVGINPTSGRPFIHPFHDNENKLNPPGETVHVVCGGGTGAAVFSMLLRKGYSVTAGALNKLDTDQQIAEALKIPCVEEAPFSPIGEAAKEKVRTYMNSANCILITDCPFGRGNLINLSLSLEAQEKGKPVYFYGSDDIEERDFTGGQALQLWRKLRENGAKAWEDKITM